jgi:hypothetical protein
LVASLDAAYAEEETFALVDTDAVVSSNVVATRASSKARPGSAARERKLNAKPASGELAGVDAVFAGIGEGVAAA